MSNKYLQVRLAYTSLKSNGENEQDESSLNATNIAIHNWTNVPLFYYLNKSSFGIPIRKEYLREINDIEIRQFDVRYQSGAAPTSGDVYIELW